VSARLVLGPPGLRAGLILAAAALAVLPRGGHANPVPTLHPGGVDAPADTVVLDFPAERSPILIALRAGGPLSVDAGPASARADSAAISGAPSVAVASAAPAAGGSLGASPGDGITFSGLKTVSVEMGANRGASLEQSLDLTVRGRVAGDVEVAAMLSDQRLPFEPDGSSRELEDLDRLTLQIRSSRAEATMGDFFLDGIPGQFARMTRHLEGVRGEARVGGASWNVAAASTKGEKRTLEFRGEEGRQGPYPLVSAGLAADAPGVVAGSEVVWLDGARLKRGADDDYVIDYGAGTVTFTVRHPVTAQSRIAVDFESATSRYRRSLYAATTQGGRPGGSWYASYVHEGDDPKNPMGVDLSAADRATLSAMGDSATTVLPSGVAYEGPGKGSYAWDESDAANPHWIFLGTGRGDYDVQFASVGPGRGAYADTMSTDGTQFYRFRGLNLGSFEPGRPIAVPNSRRLVDFGGSARLFHSLSLEGEAARSDLDRNALSSRDDGDNAGGAARLSARLDPRSMRLGGKGIGSVRAEALIRTTGSTFDAFDRIEPAFEAERWNQSSTAVGENRQEFALQYDPSSTLALRGELGQRLDSGGSRSLRRAAMANLRSFVSGAVHWEAADNSLSGNRGSRSLWGFELARERGIVAPRLSAREERIQGQEGDSVDARSSREWLAGLTVAPATAVRLRGGYSIRDGATVATLGGPAALDHSTAWDGGITARAGTSLSIDGGFTRRRVESASGPQGTNLAQLAMLAGRPGAPVTSELRYDVTQLREAALVRTLTPTQAGSGSYDVYGNPRLGGGYELVTSTGDLETRSRAVVQLRLDTYPGRAPVKPGARRAAWRGLGGSSFLRVETLSSLPLGRLDQAIDPSSYLSPENTVRGSLVARQTMEYVPAAGRYDVRAELGVSRDQNGEIESLRTRRSGLDSRLTVRHPLPGRLRATASAAYDRSEQSIELVQTGDAVASTLRGRGFELEISRELRREWTVSVLSRQRRDVDMSHGGYFDLWSVGPTARYSSGARLRIDGRMLQGWSSQQGAYAPPGLYAPATLGRRIDYDFLGEYRVHDQVSLSLSWTGFKAPRQPAYYTGRFELKGSF
jgi:hypothetical protein